MDRLSDLPDALLHHIFSFMPMQDVVHTTALSSRWKGLWTSAPDLLFDVSCKPLSHSHDFVEFVNQTINYRGSSKIKSFKIKFFLNRIYRVYLDFWIQYALENGVEELLLTFIGNESSYVLPKFLYTCTSVKSLMLSMCNITFATEIRWSSLKNLKLHSVVLWRDAMQKVLKGCPKLESLEVSHCEGFDGLSTNSPYLKKLIITDSLPLTEVPTRSELRISAPNVLFLHMSGVLYRKCLIDMVSLVEATLDFQATLGSAKGFDDHQDILLGVLRSLGHVQNLTLGTWCIKVLSIKEKKCSPSPPSLCKSLTLNSSIKQEDIPGILHLLKCSPHLEMLELNMASTFHEKILYQSELGMLADFCNFGGEGYLVTQVDIFSCLQLHLKTININQFVDENSVIPLISFLLKEAKVLEKIAIKGKDMGVCWPCTGSLLSASHKLLYMPRSSPDASVKLLNSDSSAITSSFSSNFQV